MRGIVLGFAAVLAAWPAMAADPYPAQQLLSTAQTVAGEPIVYPTTGPAKVTALIVTIAAGAETVLHHHPAPMFAYILDGEVTVDYGAKGKRVFRPGEAFMEAQQVPHKGINSGTTPVRILAVSMGAEGTANVAAER